MFEAASYYGLSCRACDAADHDPSLMALARSWPAPPATLRLLDLIDEATGGGPLAVLDLACATGSLSRSLLRRFPDARVTALEHDPVLLTLAAHQLAPFRERCRLVAADPAGSTWARALAGEIPTVAVAAGRPAWHSREMLAATADHLVALLPPGGVFLACTSPVAAPPRGWWACAAAHPALAAVGARSVSLVGCPSVDPTMHAELLEHAGFRDVTVVDRTGILLARR